MAARSTGYRTGTTSAWEESSACRHEAPGLFFPSRTDSLQVWEAKRLCARCPVARECLDEAVLRGHTGIWGGTTPEERHRLR